MCSCTECKYKTYKTCKHFCVPVRTQGPPDVATDLEVGKGVSFSSAEICWFPGFDYGDIQTFTVVSDGGGKSDKSLLHLHFLCKYAMSEIKVT